MIFNGKLNKVIALSTLFFCTESYATEYEPLRDFQVSESANVDCHQCLFDTSALINGELLSTWQTIDAGNNALHFQIFTNNDLTNGVSSTSRTIDFGSIEISSPQSISESTGGFSLFWVEDGTAIAAQGYNDIDNPIAPASVLTTTASPINGLDVAVFDDGTRMVIWSTAISLEERQIFGLRLDSDNLPIGQVTELNKATLLGSGMIKLFPLPANKYYLAYEAVNEAGNIRIAMDLHDSEDEIIKSDMVDSMGSTEDNLQVNGAILGDHSILLTWIESSLNESKIFAQRFDANGLEENTAFVLLNNTEDNISRPSVHSLLDGNYVLTWRKDNDLTGMIFSFTHKAISEELNFNSDALVSAIQSTGLNFHSDISIAAVSSTQFTASFREGENSGSELKTAVFELNRAAHAAPGEPTADAGSDVLYHGRDSHYLSASNSRDAFGYTRLRYQWELVSKPLDSTVNLSTSFASPSFYPDKLGEYKIQLTVRNRADGITNTDTITFYNYNNPPIADAGEDKTVDMIGSAVQLSSSDSYDIDNDYLWYEWEIVQMPEGSSAALDNTSSPTPRFIPDVRGTYKVQLTVRDAWSDSEPDVIVVGIDNKKPHAHAEAPKDILVNQVATLDGSDSHDANQDAITYQWTFIEKPAGSTALLDDATIARPSFTPDIKGKYNLSLTVNDGLLDSDPKNVTVDVDAIEEEEENIAPIANAGEDIVHNIIGWVVQLDGRNSSDENGDTLTYEWKVVTRPKDSDASLDYDDSPTPRLIADMPGYYHVSLIVNDGELSSQADEVVINIPNAAPRADAGIDRTVNPGDTVQLDGSSSTDPNGEEITYIWEFVQIPSWSMTTLNDTTSATPSFNADVPGVYKIKLTATDGYGLSDSDVVVINASNQAPIANAGLDQTMQSILSTVLLDGSQSSDPEGLPLNYRWEFVTLPAGATSALNNAFNADATFNPSVHGVYEISLIVNDGIEDSVMDTVKITVLNQAPIANAGNDLSIDGLGGQIQLDGSQSRDIEGQALTFQWVMTAKPANSEAELSKASTVNPTFTGDAFGTYEMSLIVNDGYISSTADTMIVNVLNTVPVAQAGEDQLIKTFGNPVMLDGSASSDADGHSLTYQWTMLQKPANSVVNISDADAQQANFTPDVPGIYEVSLMVNDGFDSGIADTVLIEVADPVVEQKPTMGGETSREVIESMITYANFGLEMYRKHFENERQNVNRNKEARLLKRQARLVAKLQKILDNLHMHKRSTRIMSRSIKHFDGCETEGQWNKADLVGDCEAQFELTTAMNLAIDLRNAEIDVASRDLLIELRDYVVGLDLSNFTKTYKNERQNQKRNSDAKLQQRKHQLTAVIEHNIWKVENHRRGAKLGGRLERRLSKRLDGCERSGSSDRNDWVGSCDTQSELNTLLREAIDSLKNQTSN